jgi:hypothetical protein
VPSVFHSEKEQCLRARQGNGRALISAISSRGFDQRVQPSRRAQKESRETSAAAAAGSARKGPSARAIWQAQILGERRPSGADDLRLQHVDDCVYRRGGKPRPKNDFLAESERFGSFDAANALKIREARAGIRKDESVNPGAKALAGLLPFGLRFCYI